MQGSIEKAEPWQMPESVKEKARVGIGNCLLMECKGGDRSEI